MYRKTIIILFSILSQCFGQYYFGGNKIQPFEYEWTVLQTPNFDIYHYEQEKELAKLAGQIAERTHFRYTSHFGFAPQERIPIVIYSAPGLFAETHTVPFIIPEGIGGFTEYFKGRVILPYNGSIADFEHILAHELVHVWQLHYAEFLNDAHELFFIHFPPLWFVEGQAELLSSVDEPQHERTEVIRALANDGFVLPRDFNLISGSYKMYELGASFLRFLRERFGHDADVKLFERIWESVYFDELIKSQFGVSVEDAGLQWRQWLLKRFSSSIAQRTPQKIAGKILSPEGFFFSPIKLDSASIICKGNRLGYAGIYILRNGKSTLVEKIEMTESAEATRLFENRIALLGDSIAVFSAKSKGKDRLILLNIKSGKKRAFEFEEIVAINSPSCGEGRNVLFSGTAPSGFTDIYSVDISTGKLAALTEDHFLDMEPIACGGQFLFVSDREEKEKMGIYQSNGGNLLALAAGAEIYRPKSLSLSPDERFLAFVADDDTFPDVYIIDLLADTLWRATYLSEPVFNVHFAGGSPRPDNFGIISCTLLVSVSSGNQVVIQRIIPDSMTFIGVFPKERAKDFWRFPADAPLLATGAEVSKPNAHKLTFDIAQGEVATTAAQEMGGGLELMLSDMVGDRRLYLFVLEAAQSWEDLLGDLNAVVVYETQGLRWSKGIGAYHLHFRSYNRYEGLYDERQAGIMASAGYALSRFMRFEGTAYAYYSHRDDRARNREDAILSASLSLIRDSSIWGITGPMDGMRSNFTIGTALGASGTMYRYLVSGDMRYYLRITRNTCLANRLILRHSDGPEPQRFYMGGTWDFRGYPYFYFFGKNQALFNTEFRFPLFERIFINTPILDIDMRGIYGAIFFDAGDAWEGKFKPVGSFGVGARMNLDGYVVLRLDLAQTTDFKTTDPHWKWDIFFGWDF